MNARRAMQLMEQYQECPDCGNQYVGSGEGNVEVSDDTFKRTCKCGWAIEVKE
ncbi:DUF3797 domain-containing protein [Brevibacillus agri]|nr:DUF3797 domain-containing protein [Brevibacillus agri]MBY0052304.1 DUF3797 domain-containing protein [Brevibacillus agri]